MEENFFIDPEAIVPAGQDPESDDALLDVARELHAYLQGFGARLVHNDGAVAVEVAGNVEVDGRRYPFRLVPERCVLARVQKWRKLTAERHLALVRERLNEASVAEFESEVHRFVARVLREAEAEGWPGGASCARSKPARSWRAGAFASSRTASPMRLRAAAPRRLSKSPAARSSSPVTRSRSRPHS
ncbi:hypothetical protein PA01_19165 [Azoarcus sp. PA01]|nr:hypothetical protein PA01_19165 [Azoarcus sp. PA01]